MGRVKIEKELTNVKVMIIQYFRTFFGGDLQVVQGEPLRLSCKQNLPCQKTLRVLLNC